GPSVCTASARVAADRSGRSAGTTASASAPRSRASSSAWRSAAERGGFSSSTARARRRAAISNTASSGETTQVSQPGTESVASRTSSSMARVRAALSRGERRGWSRLLLRPSAFTGTAMTRIGPERSRGPWTASIGCGMSDPPTLDRSEFGPNEWLIDEMYRRFREDPESVGAAWREFFEDYRPPKAAAPERPAKEPAAEAQPPRERNQERDQKREEEQASA